MPLCLLSRHYWFWPVCASTSAIISDKEEMEHGQMEGALGSNWMGRLRICWNSGSGRGTLDLPPASAARSPVGAHHGRTKVPDPPSRRPFLLIPHQEPVLCPQAPQPELMALDRLVGGLRRARISRCCLPEPASSSSIWDHHRRREFWHSDPRLRIEGGVGCHSVTRSRVDGRDEGDPGAVVVLGGSGASWGVVGGAVGVRQGESGEGPVEGYGSQADGDRGLEDGRHGFEGEDSGVMQARLAVIGFPIQK
ncbi:hypothetical protein BHM03_00028910 [Ensete ventricosum]|nr:hypothetical protein BHM03_00028910 [Ensete ventricosum]